MKSPPPVRFLDAKLLRSIAGIELKARLLVEGMYASRHRSPDYGYSVEFVDHREYTRGDELRTIDWKMLARTERYFVKRFEMESNMNVVCLLDTSGSMGYVPQDKGRLSKLEYGSYLAAALSHLATHQQDSRAPMLSRSRADSRALATSGTKWQGTPLMTGEPPQLLLNLIAHLNDHACIVRSWTNLGN